jgi:microcystin-dependent protein
MKTKGDYMKLRTNRIARYLTLAAVTTAGASFSTGSYACAAEPYLSAVCVMGWARNDLRGYAPAAGQVMSISQNSALFALLGTTYGGDGQVTFGLPDLRGRVVIGTGTGSDGTNYVVGQKAGNASVTLTAQQLPSHSHVIPAVALSGVAVTIDLSRVTGATAALTGVPFTADTSLLTLKANNAAAGTASPTGASLAVSAGPANRIYTSTSPDVEMRPGTFGGSIAVSSTGTAPVTFAAGSTSATLSGTLPAGVSGLTGGNSSFSVMQPYLAMNYFIATTGIFPSSN